ncbi:hypothetical protein F5Y11DRAFT_319865 [Daldinia sp. FL1419]|nr:hypothetical protein F5Y11DRAFT_319865 [Daldinia sp. FL1419]
MTDFFIEKLNVPVLDADIVYDELLEPDPEEATVEHVKDLLWIFNLQIELNPSNDSAEELLQCRILPESFRDIYQDLQPRWVIFNVVRVPIDLGIFKPSWT